MYRFTTDDLGNAVHEAGHAVVAHVLGYQVKHVNIVPTDGKLGEVSLPPPNLDQLDCPLEVKQAVARDYATINAAGIMAEKRLYGIPYRYNGNQTEQGDIPAVHDLAKHACLDGEELLRDGKLFAEAILERYWAVVWGVTEQLLERKQLQGDDLRRTIEEALPPVHKAFQRNL